MLSDCDDELSARNKPTGWPLLAHKELSSYPDAERCYDRSDNRDKEDFGREVFWPSDRVKRSPKSTSAGAQTTADKTFAVLKRNGGMCIMPAKCRSPNAESSSASDRPLSSDQPNLGGIVFVTSTDDDLRLRHAYRVHELIRE
jgi:hypothetical protein